MLPEGHVGIVVCGTRRAERWREAFRAAGIDAVVVETDADEAEAGACQVGVPRARLLEANAIVTAVTRGERRLRTGMGWQGIVAIVIAAAFLGGIALALAR